MERWAASATPDSEDGRMSPPRPPDHDLVYDELLTRPSFCNASFAYREIERGRAEPGNSGTQTALRLRGKIQALLFSLGCLIHGHSGKILFIGMLVMSILSVGLKVAKIETNVEKLWVEVGGRLEKELKYTKQTLGEGAGITQEIIVQTPLNPGMNILTHKALLQHVRSAIFATQIHVDMFGLTWDFRDVCYITPYPSFEDNLLDGVINELMPCTIITPLDCFWEGARLLGPENAIQIPDYEEPVRWTNLDPQALLEVFEKYRDYVAPESLEDIFNRTGIGHAYQDKPCLNPYDPECPNSAPNKQSGELPDVAAAMNKGCAGYASAYMKWPEELILGGAKRNVSGHLQSAEALQTLFLLNGQKEMYERWKNDFKVSDISWTPERAKAIIDEWERKFTQRVRNSSYPNSTQDVNAFSAASFEDLLQEFSEMSVMHVAMGYLIMVGYACVTMVKWYNGVQSQGGVGLFGVILVAGAVTASLGFCAAVGISFNASTTQVLPFLALGVGVDDMFLLAHSSTSIPREIPLNMRTGEVLRRSGVSVLLTSVNNFVAFSLAAVIPIPALRSLSLQFAIVIVFNFLAVILVFPAILSLDAERRDAKRVDIFCCFKSSSANRVIRVEPRPIGETVNNNNRRQRPHHQADTNVTVEPASEAVQTVTHAAQQPGGRCTTVLHPSVKKGATDTIDSSPCGAVPPVMETPPSTAASTSASTRTLIRMNSFERDRGGSWRKRWQENAKCWRWSLSGFARGYYAPFLQKLNVKVGVLVFFACLLGVSIYGVLQMEDGLELTDIVPRGTREEDFLRVQNQYFSFYNMYAVTQKDFDYPYRQRQLHAFHNEFHTIPEVIRDSDGSLPSYWLAEFRDWLLDMQKAFDVDKAGYAIQSTLWYPNASDKGVLAYKMMVQTGEAEIPFDLKRFHTGRLVDSNGIINPSAFYHYLTVWVNYDTLSYAASQGNIHPRPSSWQPGGKTEHDLTIPKARALNFTQLPFYLDKLRDTNDFVRVIKSVRNLSSYYSSEGLPNYPMGVPFTFWEQYLHLRFYLGVTLASVLGASFVVITIMLVNPWAALILVLVLGMITVELFGFMGLIGIKLSAIPAVTLVISVGIGVEFTLHMCYAFLTSIGDREKRMAIAVEHTFTPIVDGALSTLLGVIMLAGSEFDFIVSYFFHVFSALIVIGVLNGLVLLPVLLSLFGPPGEVQLANNAERMTTPTPPPTPVMTRGYDMHGIPPNPPPPHRRSTPYAWDHDSEGSQSSMRDDTYHHHGFASEHIEIHPQVFVETTTCHPPCREERKQSRTHHHHHQNPSYAHERPQYAHQRPQYAHQQPSYTHERPPHTHQKPSYSHRPSRAPHRTMHPHVPQSYSSSSPSESPPPSPHHSPSMSSHHMTKTTVTATARVSIVRGMACGVDTSSRRDNYKYYNRRKKNDENCGLPELEVKNYNSDSTV